MKVLRTPDECFDKLAGYPFEPHYLEVPDGEGEGGTLRVHHVDEGPRDAPPVVFLHGNPTWSYLWRRIIPPVVAAGHRAIALDLVGTGRSDKPCEMTDYTVARHVEWMRAAIVDTLALRDVCLVLHDWGGIIGLRILGEHPDRIARVCVSNTGFPVRDPAEPLPPGCHEPTGPLAGFQKMVRESPSWPHWEMLRALTIADLPQEVVDGFHAPYPDEKYLAGNRQFTQLLPTTADNPMHPANWQAWQVVKKFERPFLTLFSDKDQVAPNGHLQFRDAVPGAQGQPHTILLGGSHFLQEDVPDAYAEVLVDWLDRSA